MHGPSTSLTPQTSAAAHMARAFGLALLALGAGVLWFYFADYSIRANWAYGEIVAGAGDDEIPLAYALMDAAKFAIPLFVVIVILGLRLKTGVPLIVWHGAVIAFAAWSLLCSVSLQMDRAATQIAGRAGAADDHQRLERSIAKYEASIAALKRELSRPRDVIEGEIAAERQKTLWGESRTKGCTNATVDESIVFCQKHARLVAEAAAARSAAEIRAELSQAQGDLRDAKAELRSLGGAAAHMQLDPGLAMMADLADWAQGAADAPELREGDAPDASRAAEAAALMGAIRSRAIIYGALLEAAMTLTGYMLAALISAMIAEARAAIAARQAAAQARASLEAERLAAEAQAKAEADAEAERAAKELAERETAARRSQAASRAGRAKRPARRKITDPIAKKLFALRYGDSDISLSRLKQMLEGREGPFSSLKSGINVATTTISAAIERIGEAALTARNAGATEASLAKTYRIKPGQMARAIKDANAARQRALRSAQRAAA